MGMAKNNGNNCVTRKDLENVVGGAVAEILNVMGGHFMCVQEQLNVVQTDVAELKVKIYSIEHKLDAAIKHLIRIGVKIDKHDKIISTWRPKPA